MSFDIFTRRKQLGLSLEDIGKKVGVSKSTVKKWESGFIENMKRDKVALLAEVLQVSPLEILGVESEPTFPPNIIPIPKMRRIPLLGKIACGAPVLATEEHDEFVIMPEGVDADFALQCKGDSMVNARILDGDIVYIRQQEDVDNGEIAAVLIDDEATLKRVYKYPEANRVMLMPENPAYAPLVYEGPEIESIRILGKAVSFLSGVR